MNRSRSERSRDQANDGAPPRPSRAGFELWHHRHDLPGYLPLGEGVAGALQNHYEGARNLAERHVAKPRHRKLRRLLHSGARVPGSALAITKPWFCIYPLGSDFSYEPDPAKYKGVKWIIDNLVDTAAKGGGLMVGVGPSAHGEFHPEAAAK